MAAPDIPNSIQVHAAGFVNAAAGTLRASSANIKLFTKLGVGSFRIIFGSNISLESRHIDFGVSGPIMASVNISNDAVPNFIDIEVRDSGGVLVDSDFYFHVGRHSL